MSEPYAYDEHGEYPPAIKEDWVFILTALLGWPIDKAQNWADQRYKAFKGNAFFEHEVPSYYIIPEFYREPIPKAPIEWRGPFESELNWTLEKFRLAYRSNQLTEDDIAKARDSVSQLVERFYAQR